MHEVEANSRGAIAILGGNACALEVITLLDTHPILRRRLASVLCITGGGDLPDASPSGLGAKPAFANLVALDSSASLDADTLFAAVRHDLDEARAVGFNALDYVDPLYARFLPLLVRLSSAERRRFAEAYGRRFKSFGRHAPPFYRRAAANLVADGLLRTERGSVHTIRLAQAGFRVLWQDPAGTEHALDASIVLDCRGWGYLDEASDPFLVSLLAPTSALARTNGSRIGLITDEEFQTSAACSLWGRCLPATAIAGTRSGTWRAPAASSLSLLLWRRHWWEGCAARWSCRLALERSDAWPLGRSADRKNDEITRRVVVWLDLPYHQFAWDILCFAIFGRPRIGIAAAAMPQRAQPQASTGAAAHHARGQHRLEHPPVPRPADRSAGGAGLRCCRGGRFSAGPAHRGAAPGRAPVRAADRRGRPRSSRGPRLWHPALSAAASRVSRPGPLIFTIKPIVYGVPAAKLAGTRGIVAALTGSGILQDNRRAWLTPVDPKPPAPRVRRPDPCRIPE